MATACPHCGGEQQGEYKYCSHCGRRLVDFKSCPECDEPVSAQAKRCPHCAQPLSHIAQRRPDEQVRAVPNLNLEARATHLGAFFASGSITALLIPPVIRASNKRITVTKWSLFGLRTHSQEIQVSRVASVRHTKGVFWGALLVETFGGASEDLSEGGLKLEDARKMALNLKACLQD